MNYIRHINSSAWKRKRKKRRREQPCSLGPLVNRELISARRWKVFTEITSDCVVAHWTWHIIFRVGSHWPFFFYKNTNKMYELPGRSSYFLMSKLLNLFIHVQISFCVWKFPWKIDEIVQRSRNNFLDDHRVLEERLCTRTTQSSNSQKKLLFSKFVGRTFSFPQ